MIGISLITQFITYPLFKSIDLNLFSNFHKAYTRKMLFIVGPVMIIEFLSLAILLFVNFNFNFLIQFILICLIWVLTFFVIVPIHNKLENQYDKLLNINLINTNGYRTLIWSIKIYFFAFYYLNLEINSPDNFKKYALKFLLLYFAAFFDSSEFKRFN